MARSSPRSSRGTRSSTSRRSSLASGKNQTKGPLASSSIGNMPDDMLASPNKMPKSTSKLNEEGKKDGIKSSFHSPESNKENTQSTPIAASPRVTPYWEVLKEGRASSPRLTRSATKTKKRESVLERVTLENISDEGEEDTSNDAAVFDDTSICLNFSPPDHKKNLENERKTKKKKEKERSEKIRKARNSGQLLLFSPPNKSKRKSASNLKRKDSKSNPSSFCIDFSPSLVRNSEENKVERKRSSKRVREANDDASINGEGLVKKKKCVTHEQYQEEMKKYLKKLNKMEKTNETLIKDIQKINKIQRQEVLEKEKVAVNAIAEAKNEKLQLELNSLIREKNDLETKYQTEIRKNISIDDQCSKKKDDVIKEMNEAIKKLEADLSQTNIDKINLEETLMRTKEENQISSRSYFEDISKMKNKIEEIRSDLANSQNEKEDLKEKYEKDLGKNGKKDESNNAALLKMKTLVENSITKLKEAEIENKRLSSQLKSTKEESHQTGKKLEHKDKEFEKLQSKLLEAQMNLAKISSENENLLQETSSHKDMKNELLTLMGKAEQLDEKLNTMTAEKETMEKQLTDLALSLTQATKRYKEEKENSRIISEKLKEEISARGQEQKTLQSLQNDLETAEQYILKLQRILKGKEKEARTAIEERDSAMNHIVKFDQREDELNRRLRVMDEVRRDLHNKVMRLSGNMKVFVRVRPELDGEVEAMKKSLLNSPATKSPYKKNKHKSLESLEEAMFNFPGVCDRKLTYSSSPVLSSEDLSKSLVEVTEPYKDRGGLSSRRKKWTFGFDGIFSPTHGQSDMWIGCEPMIQSAIDGYNVCLFAYGQTGSGKTFTMLGDSTSANNQGVIYRAVRKMFEAKDSLEVSTRGAAKASIHIEMLEIYNDKVRDLLDPSSGKSHNGVEINLKISSNEALDNIVATAENEEDVSAYLNFAQKRRCVKATKSNSESSRSHLLFTIHFIVENENNPLMNRSSKLHICDLAGSERLAKSGSSSGSLLKEAQYINSSLSALSNVICALQSKKSHIPFRDSKLTYLLQDSLGGESKTLAIVCCSPLSVHFHESICSLRFAEKMNRVELKTKQIA